MNDGARMRLKQVRDGLLRLHMSLLTSERAAYERDVERITSPGQYLNLALNDPWFAWLRELSQFIVVIDETMAQKEPASDEDAERLIVSARTLIAPGEDGEPFARSYWEAMQRDPAAVLAHGEMMRVFAALPE
jgi:hypothetical protein